MNIPLFSSLSDIDQAGVNLICSLGIPPMDAFLLLKDLLNASRGRGNRIARARKCIRLGEEALVNREKSVPFSHAIAASLEAKSHRRPRTLQEIRYIATRMMKKCPELARKQVRSITPEDCEHYLLQSFSTVRQRYKGRLILSGILNFSLKRGWCRKNAASLVPPPPLKETRIRALSLYEAKQLLHTAKRMFSGECLPACALMLYAGIRPYEVRRLTWNRINLKSGLVSLAPNHTKTGGSRHVSILPVLAAILNQAGSMHNSGKLVCPPNWRKVAGYPPTVRYFKKEGMGTGRAKAHVRILSPGPFRQLFPSSEGDGACHPLPSADTLSEYGRNHPHHRGHVLDTRTQSPLPPVARLTKIRLALHGQRRIVFSHSG